MGQIDFRDFLWESTLDTASDTRMGDTAENLAKRYAITREEVDTYAAMSFARAVEAWEQGYYDDEVVKISDTQWTLDGYATRSLRLADRAPSLERDGHVRATDIETLSKLRPAFSGVQTGGNSSAIVDGAAAVLVASGDYVRSHGLQPLARIVAGATVGVPPEIMGIGPAPAIRALLQKANLGLSDISRFEINEAFGAQYLAVERELGIDCERVNRHGGAIAIGHPLAASGVRLTHTVARQLQRDGEQFGISSACAGGGQGIAILLKRA
jgi:acetyl-CoA C-acetyltransferase